MTLQTLTSSPARAAIRQKQLTALKGLLAELVPGNRFYTPILRAARLDGSIGSLQEFFEKMPFTEKAAVIEDHHRHPPYGTNLTYPLGRYSRYNQTSATRGAPLRWLDTRESWQWMLNNWKQVLRAARVEPADCLYFAFSFGPFLGFWTAMEAATQIECLCIPGGGVSSLGRLEAMEANRATVLLCTPTYALRLTEVAKEEHFDLGRLAINKVIVAGEPGGSVPAVRQTLERRWRGAEVFDHHGMTEVGPVSYQCPERPGTLMVIESSYLAEIVDPASGLHVAPGDTGELVLTTLGRLGSPLIRYRTGDLVQEDLEIAERFGRHELALKGGILGRLDDMVLVRGVNVYPGAIEDAIRSFAEVAEYRCEIRRTGAMAELNILIEPSTECSDGDGLARRIEARLRCCFNLRVPVAVCAAGELPRFEMKAHRWVKT
ncbi:MAG: phenylacetate--CoA ligase [Rhodopirellula sp.]|nr:phenylacetate--CoA ligase [Rhodopirellula sp.]